MRKSLLPLLAVGISLQAIPASLAEEIGMKILKEAETVDFNSLKPKSAMPILKSLPTSYATSSDSYRLKPGVNIPKGKQSQSSYNVGPSNYG